MGLVAKLFDLVLQGRTLRAVPCLEFVERREAGLDAQRRQGSDEFLSESLVGLPPGERDAVVPSRVVVALAQVACVGTALAPVADVQFPSTVAASQQSDE